MSRKIFVFSFLIALLLQAFWFCTFEVSDGHWWGNQAKFYVENNPKQFDFFMTYGHPGGPLMEGTIILHKLGLSYDTALLAWLALLDALLIALACRLAFSLSQDHTWWPIVLAFLSLNEFYRYSTPPCDAVSLALVCLCLFTFLLVRKSSLSLKDLLFWSFLAALAISIRADIGSISAFALLNALWGKVTQKQIYAIALAVSAVFVALDPYMWSMPFQHLGDLLYKMVLHYNDFIPIKLNLWILFNKTILVVVGILFGLGSLFLQRKEERPLPDRLLIPLIILTVFLYIVYLTSKMQALRYFMPLVVIWEVLLPLYLFSFVPGEKARRISSALLIAYPIFSLGQLLYIGYKYNQLLW